MFIKIPLKNFHKIKTTNRKKIITYTILPEFLNIYTKAYCHENFSSVSEYVNSFENIKNCLENTIFPDLNTQSIILNNFHKIAMETDISNFERPLLKLMLENNKAVFNDLLKAIEDYNLSIDHLNLILNSMK